MPLGLGNEVSFLLDTLYRIFMRSHCVVDTINLFRAKVGASLKLCLSQFLGLRSEERKRAFQGTIVLVKLENIKFFEFSLSDLSHGSVELRLNLVEHVGQQHTCRCPK